MRHGRVAAAAALAGGLVLGTTGSAQAATSTFEDRVHETTSASDIRWVRVHNDRQDDRFRVAVKTDEIITGSSLTLFVDRNRKNPGPELRMVAVPDSEWALYRVNKWGQRGTEIATCGKVRMSASSKRDVVSWRTSRTCIGLEGAVRVSAKMTDAMGRVDWAPKKRHFYPKVSPRY